MIKILKKIYAVWGVVSFLGVYVALFPIFFIFLQKKEWHKFTHRLHQIWAGSFFGFTLMPVKIEWKFKPDPNQNYIFCSNHTSYFDIPAIGLALPKFYVFVGKSSLNKVPLFGYMFKRIHIPIDRRNGKSRYDAYEKTKSALDDKKDVILFPEGGIITKTPPFTSAFKDGAFKIAKEKNIPIVPISLPYNYKIMRNPENFELNWHKIHIVIHPPVFPSDYPEENINDFKQKVFDDINNEMKKFV